MARGLWVSLSSKHNVFGSIPNPAYIEIARSIGSLLLSGPLEMKARGSKLSSDAY